MRRLLALLLSLSAITPGFAEPASLGRLFLDPQQRARLDFQRQHHSALPASAGEAEASQTINGEVRSSNGRRTRWINGEVNWEGTALPPPVPVGDTFNPGTGEHESLLRDGRITIKPAGRAR